MMDINPAPINFLKVDGDIIIPPNNLDVTFSANGIWVRAGSIKAGTSTAPHPGKINIQLLGNRADQGFVFNEDTAGNKIFVINGKVEIYGTVPATTWTRAKSTVRQGDTRITLTSSVSSWQVGDWLAIGPSFSSTTQH